MVVQNSKQISFKDQKTYCFIIYVLSVKSLKMTSLNSINNQQMCFSMVCISSYGGDRGVN